MSGIDKSLDKLFDALSHAAEHIIEPKEKTFWHKVLHEWVSLEKWVEEVGEPWQISRGLFLTAFFVPLFVVASFLVPQFLDLVFGWILIGLPVLAPVAAIATFPTMWMWYVQTEFIFRRVDPILLEVKMPPNIAKSPRGMEHVLSNLWTRMNTTTYVDRIWKGGMLPYYSFELVSLGGEVHFYIHCRRIFKNTIEMNLYAQYPEVQIEEVEDYAMKFTYDDDVECFVTEYRLTSNVASDENIDPLHPEAAVVNAYPPKTYVDFELDQEPQEHRSDPYAQVLEVLSTCNKNEQMWIQMVFRPHFGKDWKKTLEKEVAKIRKETTQVDSHDTSGFPKPTYKQTEQIRTMERHLSKLPFEVGFRGIYSAPADKMRGPEYTAMRWIWRPFANPNWASTLRPRRGHNDFDWDYQDWNGIRYRLMTRRFIDAYRRRCFFNYPWITPFHILSTEVLATLWHPPGASVRAPGLQRVTHTKGEAPANLPV